MGKCLITKLNGICDNKALLKINEFRLSFQGVDTNSKIFAIGNKFNISSDSNFMIESDTCSPGTVYTKNAYCNIKALSSNCEFSISDKYSIGYIHIETPYRIKASALNCNEYQATSANLGETLDVKELFLGTTLMKFKENGGFASTVKDLAAKLNEFSSEVHIRSIKGDISDLGSKIYLTSIDFGNNVYGKIEDFAAAQVAAGRVSGTISGYPGNTVTYKGTAWNNVNRLEIRFGSDYPDGYKVYSNGAEV